MYKILLFNLFLFNNLLSLMEETLRQKQLFLRENILEKGYSTDDFMDLLHSKKGEQGLDLNNWTMRELSLVVKEFISYENPYDNQNNIKLNIETDEEYEQKCIQKYKEQKQKENLEYGDCSRIDKSRLNQREGNLNIKVNLPNKDMIKESGEFLVETYPNKYQVKRNFEDFEWILNYLNEQYMNYMIQQLSNKKYGEKYSEEKALKRTRALKKFLEGLALHPTLKHINILNDFLSINPEEVFQETKKKYKQKGDSEENKDQNISLKDFKNLTGKMKISINKEKEVYFMNIKDNTKINEGILKKINKSYKNLIGVMNNACEKMKEIADLWKLLSDKSQKYYETSYTIESYKIMSKIMEELLISETKKISIFNINIREYFRFVKNEFHSLNNLANRVETFKDKYYKALDKLKEDKEKLFKEQNIDSWGLNENDFKHKNVFLKNKELAFCKMMPEESNDVLNKKNIYGAYLNSLIDEYERIRLFNGKNNKENTIKILKALGGNFKFINISCESHLDNFVQVKDEEINEEEYQKYNVKDNNLFNNNMNKINKQYYNNKQINENINFRNNNNNMLINENQNIRNNYQQQMGNNNQINLNNNQNQINMNISRNNIRNNNPNSIQYNNKYNYNQIKISNQYNNQYNKGNNKFDNKNKTNQLIKNNYNFNNNNNNVFNRNQNNQYKTNNQNNAQFNVNNNNQFGRNNNQHFLNNNINHNQDNQNNINNNRIINHGQKNEENNNKNEYYDINNIKDYKNFSNNDDNYDFHINRNNNINIYEF